MLEYLPVNHQPNSTSTLDWQILTVLYTPQHLVTHRERKNLSCFRKSCCFRNHLCMSGRNWEVTGHSFHKCDLKKKMQQPWTWNYSTPETKSWRSVIAVTDGCETQAELQVKACWTSPEQILQGTLPRHEQKQDIFGERTHRGKNLLEDKRDHRIHWS